MDGGTFGASHRRRDRSVILLSAIAGIAAFALLLGAPAAGAKPLGKPTKAQWNTYTLPDTSTISVRPDPTRPIVDVVWADGTALTVRLTSMYEANADTLKPYKRSKVNLLDQSWSLFGPAVGTSWFPCSDGTDVNPDAVNFTYRGGPQSHRYDRIGLNMHLTNAGIRFKFDFCITNYRWISTDPTADLVLVWQVFPTGTKPGESERLVYPHFDGSLFYDPVLVP